MSKNILFVGPYRQTDGWGEAAKDYVRALLTTENNIAIRPIYMGSTVDRKLDEQLLALENTTLPSYDVVIEKVLPHLYEKQLVPTIGLFTLETNCIESTPWKHHILNMDGVMVPSSQEAITVKTLGYDKIVWAISEPVDCTRFDKQYGQLDGVPTDTFNFYFIGEFIKRKNLEALVTAFHREFKRTEPVNLIIKTNKSGIPDYALNPIVQKYVLDIKQRLRIYPHTSLYKPELIITDRLSDEEMGQLHQSCHCFVMPSRGEAFCRPVVDAIGYNNPVVVTTNTGMSDYVTQRIGGQVESQQTPVCVDDSPLSFLYTGRETWAEINIIDLQAHMRIAYENHQEGIKYDNRKLVESSFSYKAVGENMQKAINDYTR